MRKFFVTLSLLVAISMVLAACGTQPAAEPEQVTVVQTQIVEKEVTAVPEAPAAGPKILYLNHATEPPTLDPAIASDTTSIQVLVEAYVGLTRLHEETSQVQPGIATDWDTVDNEDGTQTLTFHLRDDIPWVRWNGSEVETVKTCEGDADRIVNANDFAYGIMRNLAPVNASPYSYLWGFVGLQGADAFANGDTDDFSTVGVEVVDDFTLSLTFNGPAAYNAQVAGLWVGYPQPQWVIEGDDCTEARGERWTEPGFQQSYGPYTVSEWIHDSEMTMVKNPFWPGTDATPVGKIDQIHWIMVDDSVGFAEYEAGNLDVSAVPSADLDRVKADPVLSQELNINAVQCTYVYGFNTQAPVVNDVRVRRALSFAVDRQGLIDNVLKGGQEPAQWFSRPGLAAAPTMADHPDLGAKYDPDAAKAELQSYLDETGQTADQLDITLMFNTSSGHQRIAEAIQQMWADTLGVNVQLVNQEWAVFLESIRSADTPQVFRYGWCADYPDANNFIREVFASGGATNNVDENGNPSGGISWYNQEFEDLVAQAAVETDPATRLDLYAQAEEIINVTDAAIIPIYFYTGVSVTKPYIVRTFAASGGGQALEKWDILDH